MMIRFNKPTLKRKDMDSVLQTMVNEQIGSGEQVERFMRSYAELVGCSRAVGYRTYPDCIKAALDYLGVVKDSTVAISPLAPSIYLEILKEIGCKVLLMDSNRENGLPDSQKVVESGADVLILYEACGSIPVRNEVAEDYGNIKILEDISESVGSFYNDLRPGYWGDAVICSFEQDNVISAGGGAGFALKNGTIIKQNEYCKLTDMGAALGLVQIENLEENCEKRREIKEMYMSGLRTTDHKAFGLQNLDFKSNAGSFSVFLNCKTDDVIKFAEKHEVPLLKTFKKSIAKEYDGDLYEICPVCASYYHRTLSFPIYPFLKATEVDIIAKIIAHLP